MDADLVLKIDSIFIEMIRKQTFEDILKPKSIEHYDEIILTTQDKLKHALKQIHPQTLYLLNKRKMSKSNDMIGNNVYVIPVHELKQLSQEERVKEELVEGLSIYYTKLYDLYNTIVAAVDPVYEYQNSQGAAVQFRLSEYNKYKDDIGSKHVQMVKEYSNQSLCQSRMDILKESVKNDELKIDVDSICKLQSADSSERKKMLVELPGIKDLEKLFYDTYDDTNMEYKHMSEESKKLYMERLDLFYKFFTGKRKRPEEINSFQKISLLDFDKSSKYCKEPLKSKMSEGMEVDAYFLSEYSKLMFSLNKSTVKRKQKLLKILNTIFKTSRDHLVVNPKLDEKLLMKFNLIVADIISRLYLSCQKHYLAGLLLFETVFNKQQKRETREAEIEKHIDHVDEMHEEEKKILNTHNGSQESYDYTLQNKGEDFNNRPKYLFDITSDDNVRVATQAINTTDNNVAMTSRLAIIGQPSEFRSQSNVQVSGTDINISNHNSQELEHEQSQNEQRTQMGITQQQQKQQQQHVQEQQQQEEVQEQHVKNPFETPGRDQYQNEQRTQMARTQKKQKNKSLKTPGHDQYQNEQQTHMARTQTFETPGHDNNSSTSVQQLESSVRNESKTPKIQISQSSASNIIKSNVSKSLFTQNQTSQELFPTTTNVIEATVNRNSNESSSSATFPAQSHSSSLQSLPKPSIPISNTQKRVKIQKPRPKGNRGLSKNELRQHKDKLNDLFYTLALNEITKQKLNNTTRSGRTSKQINEDNVIDNVLESYKKTLKVKFTPSQTEQTKYYILNKLEDAKSKYRTNRANNLPHPKRQQKKASSQSSSALESINEEHELSTAYELEPVEAIPLEDSVRKESFDMGRLVKLWETLHKSLPNKSNTKQLSYNESKRYETTLREIDTFQKDMIGDVERSYARVSAILQ